MDVRGAGSRTEAIVAGKAGGASTKAEAIAAEGHRQGRMCGNGDLTREFLTENAGGRRRRPLRTGRIPYFSRTPEEITNGL